MSHRYRLGLQGKTTLILSGLIFSALFTISFASYWQSQAIAEHKAVSLEQSKLLLLKHDIENALNNYHRNLLALHDVPSIHGYIRTRANGGTDPENGNTLQQWRNRLITTFSAFIASYPEYQQIRLIDKNGNELVRVQINASQKIEVVADSELQNKSDTPYVKETLKLKAGEAYYSDVNLNREHGVIQTPHLPVIRLASPIHNAEGETVAIVVMNIAVQRLFSGIHSDANGIERNVVDEKGYYIKHSDPSKTFGEDLNINYRFQNIEPALANTAIHQDDFMRHDEAERELDGFQKIYFSPQDRSRYWLITLHVP